MAKKKTWISVKVGIIDPKHQEEIGPAIWLFLYLLDRADWEKGIVRGYTDRQTAKDLGMKQRTIRDHRTKLQTHKYISCKKKDYKQTITIHNWTDPRKYSGKIINPPDVGVSPGSHSDQSDTPMSGGSDMKSDIQSDTQSDNEQSVSLIESSSNIKDHKSRKTSAEGKKSVRKDEDWNPLFDSLAEVCSVDPKTTGSSLAKITDTLFKADYRDVDVRQFGHWWVSDDFRKSRGIPPTLWQLQEQIGIVKVQHAQANTKHGRRLTESVEEKQKALREELGLKDDEFLQPGS